MAAYGVARDSFWGGRTGRDIARLGGKDAQILAFYLFKNPDDNMIGLYPMRLEAARERIHTLTQKAIEKAFAVLHQVEFADYDLETQHVWVREGAKYRLGIDEKPLSSGDLRAKGAQGLYERAKPNPFLEPFYRRYRRDLHILRLRRYQGPACILGRGLEGAIKPLGSQITESGTEITKQDQIQDQSQIQGSGQKNSLTRSERAPAPTRELLTQFDQLHQHTIHTRARIVPGKDAKLMADLWRSHGPIVPELITLFFQQNGNFVRGAGYTVGVFSSQFGKLLTLRAERLGHLPRREPEHHGRPTVAESNLGGLREDLAALERDR